MSKLDKQFDEEFSEYNGEWNMADKEGNCTKVSSRDIKQFYNNKIKEMTAEIVNELVERFEGSPEATVLSTKAVRKVISKY